MTEVIPRRWAQSPLIAHDSAVLLASMTAHGQKGQDLRHLPVQLKAKLSNRNVSFSVLCRMYMTQRDKLSFLPGPG